MQRESLATFNYGDVMKNMNYVSPNDTMSQFSKTADIYSRSGIGARTDWGGRPALIVVDFQRGFTNSASGVGGPMRQEIIATNQVIEDCVDRGVPIMYTAVGFQRAERSA